MSIPLWHTPKPPADGYDEALLLDVDGFVAEGAGENLFIVRNEKIYTPQLASVLSGITRDSVIQLAADLDYPVIETRITRDAVYTADEAFFTGTAAEVTPIRELDRRIIGSGSRGPITQELQSAFFDCTKGEHAGREHWLSPIAPEVQTMSAARRADGLIYSACRCVLPPCIYKSINLSVRL